VNESKLLAVKPEDLDKINLDHHYLY